MKNNFDKEMEHLNSVLESTNRTKDTETQTQTNSTTSGNISNISTICGENKFVTTGEQKSELGNQVDLETGSIAKEDSAETKNTGAQTAGVVYGNVSNASTIYGEDKFSTPRGHGFAAERANHLYDKLTGKKVELVGEQIDPETGHIVKNGADRIVDGISVQTKYCASGSKCVSECFKDGKFRYMNADGTPMQVEVPSDKYEAAVKAMEDRIKNGEVPGVKDPAEAKNIVRKGHFTYLQAKNIAKAGTVESIIYDSVNGAIVATSSFGISAALSFATSIWNGESFDVALKTATYTGLKVGGTTFVTAVLAGQFTKAGLNSALVGGSEAVIRVLGPKGSAFLVNAFRSGKNIYGAAAMKSAAKLLRSNVITGVASVVVLSSFDVVNIFRGRISGKQLFKNLAETTASVAGGTAGWAGGAAAGAAIGSIFPGFGNAVGGLIGGLVGAFAGGSLASKATHSVVSAFVEDDADEMVSIIETEFQQLAVDYLLSQSEAELVTDQLKEILTGGTLKDMYASSDREEFARGLLVDPIEKVTSQRQKIKLPTQEEMQQALRTVLEEAADAYEKEENRGENPTTVAESVAAKESMSPEELLDQLCEELDIKNNIELDDLWIKVKCMRLSDVDLQDNALKKIEEARIRWLFKACESEIKKLKWMRNEIAHYGYHEEIIVSWNQTILQKIDALEEEIIVKRYEKAKDNYNNLIFLITALQNNQYEPVASKKWIPIVHNEILKKQREELEVACTDLDAMTMETLNILYDDIGKKYCYSSDILKLYQRKIKEQLQKGYRLLMLLQQQLNKIQEQIFEEQQSSEMQEQILEEQELTDNVRSQENGVAFWTCSCGCQNTENFCTRCGKQKLAENNIWICICGRINRGNYCSKCGNSKINNINTWACSCGKINQGRFCSQCGQSQEHKLQLWECSCQNLNKGNFCTKCGRSRA